MCCWLVALTACATVEVDVAAPAPQESYHALTIYVDGTSQQISTTATTVESALSQAGVLVGSFDLVDPPLSARLSADSAGIITIVRVTESFESIPESIPYERRIVRSSEIPPDAPPRILQTGVAGLKETNYRLVYRDGLETERYPTAATIITVPVDEILMIGIGDDETAMPITGRLAYISGGRAVLLSGSTDAARQLPIDGLLDGRVFQLSPGGNYLLYTVRINDETDQTTFRNELRAIPTAEGGKPWSLQIENVLWAGWDPAGLEQLRIAYTTARSVSLPPGWEANNDLWLLEIKPAGEQPAPVRLIGTTAATFGWWGGNYAWSPTGGQLAYAFADEIGVVDLRDVEYDNFTNFATADDLPRTVLRSFPARETGGDWAWIPSLSWSANGQLLAFTENVPETGVFDLIVIDPQSGIDYVISPAVGIWSMVQWAPGNGLSDGAMGPLALSRADDPTNDIDASYSLWLVTNNDKDGARKIFPPAGTRGTVARSDQSIAWDPEANRIAFIFDNELHILDLISGESYQTGSDDIADSRPTWAPYGAAAGRQQND